MKDGDTRLKSSRGRYRSSFVRGREEVCLECVCARGDGGYCGGSKMEGNSKMGHVVQGQLWARLSDERLLFFVC